MAVCFGAQVSAACIRSPLPRPLSQLPLNTVTAATFPLANHQKLLKVYFLVFLFPPPLLVKYATV